MLKEVDGGVGQRGRGWGGGGRGWRRCEWRVDVADGKGGKAVIKCSSVHWLSSILSPC